MDEGKFSHFANRTAAAAGHPAVFAAACAIVAGWAIVGPLFGFSDTWQLVINTGTTIVTFLMVFLIQNTQNREGKAVQLKLDELIRATHGAHNVLLDIEELTDSDLEAIRKRYVDIATQARAAAAAGKRDTGAGGRGLGLAVAAVMMEKGLKENGLKEVATESGGRADKRQNGKKPAAAKRG